MPSEADGDDLRELRRFKTTLPASPLSYDGEIVKIRWCVRVRAFLRRGKEVFFEQPFQLGDIPAPAAIYDLRVPLDFDAPAGSTVEYHLHNHGFNAWTLLQLEVER